MNIFEAYELSKNDGAKITCSDYKKDFDIDWIRWDINRKCWVDNEEKEFYPSVTRNDYEVYQEAYEGPIQATGVPLFKNKYTKAIGCVINIELNRNQKNLITWCILSGIPVKYGETFFRENFIPVGEQTNE